jgi:hypothetical protein
LCYVPDKTPVLRIPAEALIPITEE